MVSEIWCLFSVYNNYDQPENNLVAWWDDRPSIEVLSKMLMGVSIDQLQDDDVVSLVNVWKGQPSRFSGHDTRYRLETVTSGTKLKGSY